MKKVLVILGPTATGKTDLGIRLAKKLGGEIIACDSRQVYKGLDIGTGKLPSKISNFPSLIPKIQKGKGYWIIEGAKIWMYDVVSPTSQYNVAQYKREADKILKRLNIQGKLPIIVGGTGLYLKSLTSNLSNIFLPVDESLREQLSKLSLEKLQQKLKSLSPTSWENLNDSDKNNPRRLVRRIELSLMYGHTDSVDTSKNQEYEFLKIGLMGPRQILYQRINLKVLEWIDQGILEEVQSLLDEGISLERFKQIGLEYSLIAKYLVSNLKDQDQLIKDISTKVRQYAKRQITYFKKEEDIIWFDTTKKSWIEKVEKKILDWYNC